ncbi:MAG: molybdate ABC transporter substrate-binding protein [Enterobacteriaceae bacterium]
MTGQWLRFFAGATLTLSVAGHALAEEGKVTVFAAASLTNAMQDIAKSIKKKGVEVVSSLPLHRPWHGRLKRGAGGSVYLRRSKMDGLRGREKSIDTASRATLLGNSLVVVAPKASAQGEINISDKTDWTSLLKGGRLAVGDPEHVPAGIYAKEALQKLGAWETLSPKLAPAEDVRGALALVERSEAPRGSFTAPMRSPAKGKVDGTFPEDSHKKVEYPLAIVDGHKMPRSARFMTI